MAAKVLLGVVALAAIVGSPIAYNHLSSSSGETQKGKETPKHEQANVAEPQKPASSNPVNRAPEAAEGRQDTKEQSPLPEEKAPAAREEAQEKSEDGSREQASVQLGAPSGPKSDECQLGKPSGWNEVPTLSPQMHCVREKVQELRGSQQ